MTHFALLCALLALFRCCCGQLAVTTMTWTEGQSLVLLAFFPNRDGDAKARTATVSHDDNYIGYYIDNEEIDDADTIKSSRLVMHLLHQPHRGVALTVRGITKADEGKYMFDIGAASLIVAYVDVQQRSDADVLADAATHPTYYASSFLGKEGETVSLNFTLLPTSRWELCYMYLVSKNDIDPDRLTITVVDDVVTATIVNATQADSGNYKFVTSYFHKSIHVASNNNYRSNATVREQYGLVMVLPVSKPCEDGMYADAATSTFFSNVCLPCSVCNPWTQVTIASCSQTSDAVCACSEGTYSSYPEQTCTAFSLCSQGSYMEVPGTHTRDRQCAPCPPESYSYKPHNTECVRATKDNPDDKLIVSVSIDSDSEEDDDDNTPAWIGDTSSWEIFANICGEGTYVGAGRTAYERHCLQCSQCDPATQLEDAPCSPTADTVCKCVEGMYRTSDATCSNFSLCAAGTFMVTPGTPDSDVVCAKCIEGTYSKGEHNTECVAHTVCATTKRVTIVAGTAAADSVCTSCTKYNPRLPSCVKAATRLQDACYAGFSANAHSQVTTVKPTNMLFYHIINDRLRPKQKQKKQ